MVQHISPLTVTKERKMIRTVVSIAALALATNAHAQAKDESFTVGGYFDAYYSVNFNHPKESSPTYTSRSTGGQLNPQQTQERFYDRYTDQIILNLAQMNFTKQQGKFTGHIALDFGTTADMNDPDDEIGKHIGIAYGAYVPDEAKRWRFQLGKVPTIIGIELYRGQDNWNYSRTTYYGLGIPFWYESFEAQYTVVPDVFTAKAVIANNWGPRVSVPSSHYDQNNDKLLGALLTYTGVKSLVANYSILRGDEQDVGQPRRMRTIHNVNATYDFSTKLAVAFDAIYSDQKDHYSKGKDAHYMGASLMAKYWVNDWFWVSPRVEHFQDNDGLAGLAAPATSAQRTCPGLGGGAASGSPCQTQNNVTLTNTVVLDKGAEFRLEYRRDSSNSKYFIKDGNTGKLSKTQTNLTAALLFKF